MVCPANFFYPFHNLYYFVGSPPGLLPAPKNAGGGNAGNGKFSKTREHGNAGSGNPKKCGKREAGREAGN